MDATTMTRVAGLHRALDELGNGVSTDLTLRQMQVLTAVGSRSAPVSQLELAEELDSYRSTISKIVAALSSGDEGDVRRDGGLGLIRVDMDPKDLRSRVISLTAEGEKILSRMVKQAFR